MQTYFCNQCKQYSHSESCSVHGTDHTSPVISSSSTHPHSEMHLVFNKGQEDESSQATAQAGQSVSQALRAPGQIDLTPGGVGKSESKEILRFRKSERLLHWAIAVPFMVCWASALILVLVYDIDPTRPFRDIFSWVHRLSGVCLITFPILVIFRNRKDYKIHFYNIKTAWLWSLNDFKWLALMGLAAISKRIVLPEQGKFNAAEKVNFMSVMVACPIFIVTGGMIWLHTMAWAAWLVHGTLALFVSPTMLGHIYMATVNPDTRAGLRGMISGYVDRKWARHHYALWYKEHFVEEKIHSTKPLPGMVHPPDPHVHIHCDSCNENMSVTWSWIVQQALSSRSIHCPKCGAIFASINTIANEL